MSSFTTCPACQYTRQSTDDTPDWECPKCHKAYVKTSRTETDHESETFPSSPRREHYIQSQTINSDPILQEKQANQACKQILYDASSFSDPIAMKACWTQANPMKRGFCNRELIETSISKLEFSPQQRYKFGGTLLIIIGFGEVIFVSSSHPPDAKMVIILLISAAFIIAGWYYLRLISEPVAFDKLHGYFLKGRKIPNQTLAIGSSGNFAKFEDIHAIQLIYWDERVPGRMYTGGNFRCDYIELNLILNNSDRINVTICFAWNRDKLRKDAERLATYLKKPLWDAIDDTTRLYDISRSQKEYDHNFSNISI